MTAEALPPLDADGLLVACDLLEKVIAGEAVVNDETTERATLSLAAFAGAVGAMIALEACVALENALTGAPGNLDAEEKDELSRFCSAVREYAPTLKQ